MDEIIPLLLSLSFVLLGILLIKDVKRRVREARNEMIIDVINALNLMVNEITLISEKCKLDHALSYNSTFLMTEYDTRMSLRFNLNKRILNLRSSYPTISTKEIYDFLKLDETLVISDICENKVSLDEYNKKQKDLINYLIKTAGI